MKTQKSVIRRIKRRKSGQLARNKRTYGAKGKKRSTAKHRAHKKVALDKSMRRTVRRMVGGV